MVNWKYRQQGDRGKGKESDDVVFFFRWITEDMSRGLANAFLTQTEPQNGLNLYFSKAEGGGRLVQNERLLQLPRTDIPQPLMQSTNNYY